MQDHRAAIATGTGKHRPPATCFTVGSLRGVVLASALLLALATGFGLIAAPEARAEVTAVTPNGFTNTHVHTLALPPADAWSLLTDGLPKWWDADHSYGGVAANLSLEAGPGGCLCETMENGGWVEHLRVIFVAPEKTLRLQGALGPLAEMGLQGVMTWTLEPAGESETTFTSKYLVTGTLEGGFEQLAPIVDRVNGGHFIRLERVAAGQPADG